MQITGLNLQNLVEEVSEEFLPQEECGTIEWMEENLYIPKEESDKDGLYDSDMTPYFWGIAHAFDHPEVEMCAVQKAAQIGWTLLLCGWLFKVIKTAPTRILALFSKDGQVVKFFEDKFNPIGKVCAALSNVLDFSTSRKSGNRANEKKYPGGYIRGFGSNSVSNVKSTPAPRVVVEESDDTNKNVGDQGDAIRLSRERLKRWSNKKFIIGGTPSVADVSIVEHHVKLGTQRVLPIECHDCGEAHVLDWEHVSWLTSDTIEPHPVFGNKLPETAVYVCPGCGSAWDDWQRKKNIYDTCKKARDSGDEWCGWVATVKDASIKNQSFKDLSELYVCLKGTSLADVVEDFLEAEKEAALGDESARIVFQNSKLAKTYAYASDAPEIETLKERAENYDEFIVPDGGLLLTAGVDVQDDRLAIVIRAWGHDEESWLVYWGEIYGNTVDKNDAVWRDLEKILFREFKHEKGFSLGMSAVSIDSSDGGTSEAVYSWVRKHQKRGVMAIKGASDFGSDREIFSLPRSVETNKSNSKASRYGLKVYIVGTGKAKDTFSKRLKLIGCGASRLHWYEDVRDDYYEQILGEVKAPHPKARGKLVWQPKAGVRNEALDCEVYCLHAARSQKVHIKTPAEWDKLLNKLMQADLFSQVVIEKKQKEAAKPQQNDDWLGGVSDEWL